MAHIVWKEADVDVRLLPVVLDEDGPLAGLDEADIARLVAKLWRDPDLGDPLAEEPGRRALLWDGFRVKTAQAFDREGITVFVMRIQPVDEHGFLRRVAGHPVTRTLSIDVIKRLVGALIKGG